jgi:ADP-ribosyl-[dinitrogen reductase] hydrolase
MPKLTPQQIDRAAGVLLGLASGDALGAGYEFRPRVPYTQPVAMNGGGALGWEPGEWTDDTAMAYCIAEVAATGVDLRTPGAQDQIARNWWTWAETAKDIGNQTSEILFEAQMIGTARALRSEAARFHVANEGRSGGNGSLMRTAPVTLAFLGEGQEGALWQAAQDISALTHWELDAREACSLWCLAIRHAVLQGNFFGLRLALEHLTPKRRELWEHRLDAAESMQSWQFANNGWVVEALQAAWSAIVHSGVPADEPSLGLFPEQHAAQAIERAVRAGNDADTVGAIAGALVGARWGGSAIPAQWKLRLHGWDHANAADLVRLAVLAARGGKPTQDPGLSTPVVDVISWPERFAFGELLATKVDGGVTALYLMWPELVLQREGGAWIRASAPSAATFVVAKGAIAAWDEAEMAGHIDRSQRGCSAYLGWPSEVEARVP